MSDTSVETQAQSPPKRQRERSPAYPYIGLEQAIARAQTILDSEGRIAVPAEAVYKDWGYKAESGPSKSTLSALRKFGLVEYRGGGADRKVQLTDRAIDILLRERGDPKRQEAVRAAALAPKIHADLYERYREGLPSDHTLTSDLRRDLRFSEVAVRDFISQFRDTLAFAGLTDAGTIPPRPNDTEDGMTTITTSRQSEELSRPSRPTLPGNRTVHLPIDSETWAVLEAAFPLTQDGWDQMIAVLQAMRPALVQPSNREKGQTDQDDDTPTE